MLQYEKNDVSKRADLNKISASKECELCHYWFFKNVGFKFEKHVCNRCQDLLTMTYSSKNIPLLSAKGTTFRCFSMGTSKYGALKKLNSSVLQDKGVL